MANAKGVGERYRQPPRLSPAQQQRQQTAQPVPAAPDVAEPDIDVAEPTSIIEEPVLEASIEEPVEQTPALVTPAQDMSDAERQLRGAAANPYSDLELAQLGIDDVEYKASLANVQAKVELLDQARAVEQSGQPIDADTQSQLTTMKALALSPFVDLTKGTVDLQTAIKSGATDEQLTALGVPITDVVVARRDLRVESEGRKVEREVGGIETERKQEWERTVLPTLLKEYQAAYRAGDTATLSRIQQSQQVSQEEFDRWIAGPEAPQELKDAYNSGGVSAYSEAVRRLQAQQLQAQADFDRLLPTLPKYLQDAYLSGGIDEYNQAVDRYNDVMRVARAVYPPLGETSMISPEMRKRAESTDFLADYSKMAQPGELSAPEYANLAPFVKPYSFDLTGAQKAGVSTRTIEKFLGASVSSPTTAKFVTPDGLSLLSPTDRRTYNESNAADRFAILQSRGIIAPESKFTGSDSAGNPIYQDTNGLETALVAGNIPVAARITAKEAKKWAPTVGRVAVGMVPVVGTVAYWNDMSPTWKALSIVLDVASIVPFVGAAAEGARAARGITRTDRIIAAVMGVTDKASGELVARGMKQELISQVRAPIDVVLHPVQATKSTAMGVWDLGENIFNPRKVPMAVLTTNYGTVRLPISATTSPAEAMAIRDKLMRLAALGETPMVEVNGVRYSLSRSAFMKEVGGGLASGTPMGELFEKGTVVNEGGLFLSHEPLPRFTQSTSMGVKGERPTFVIVSPQLAKDATPSFKTYKNTVEMELIFKSGYKVPEPTQRLYTRINGVKTEILLDKPLTSAQRAKLKGIAFVEDLKAPFKPSITVSGDLSQTLKYKSVGAVATNINDAGQVDIVSRILQQSGNLGQARMFQSAARYAFASSPIVASGAVSYYNNATGETVRDRVVLRAEGSPTVPVSRTGTSLARQRESIFMQYRPGFIRADIDDVARADALRSSDTRMSEPRASEPRVSETRAPDGRSSTDRVAETRLQEIRIPETRTPEVRTPEVRTLATRGVATRIPETRQPEMRLPETRIAEIRVPETRTTEIRIPEVRPPEVRPPEIRPPEVRPPVVRPPEVEPPRPKVARLTTNSPMSQPVPEGSIAWAMGERKGVRGMMVPQWYYIPPEDFGRAVKPRSLSAPPTGAKITNSVKPRDTIQVIGRSARGVPKLVTMDLGFADITISNGNNISFVGGGLKTDVGTRLAGNTKGMSVEEGGDYLDSIDEPTQKQGINRPKMNKKAPPRKGRRQDDFSSITSLRGLRI